ncbi:trans-resveratrol di-o-methyltransferase [Quercus suber]|uniref:Trans-resveratrol di-o-methyltransferase n=1 Tax=Quercus suber TaxID=58331 RepID=A0AAW0J8P4_QUESU|nr:trans-resveratrol di-o-methyltransferase [Quercus suber]
MSGIRQLSFKLVPGENATELLDAQAHIWNHIFNFVNSMSLKCAIELGIPDIIHNHGKPMTLSVLITALPIHPTKSPHVNGLMRILIHSGFFDPKNTSENDQEEAYVLIEPSRLLLKDNPLSITPFLLAMIDPMLTTPWII